MKTIFIFFIMLFSVLANASWHIGKWEVDEEKTKVELGENYKTFAGLAVDVMKEMTITINKNEIIIVHDKNKIKRPYKYKVTIKNEALLKTANKATDMNLGHNTKGVYMIGKKSVKFGSEPATVTKFKIYLKPSNK